MAFRFERLAIPDVILVTPERFTDARGSFTETYKRSAFAAGGIPDAFAQDNSSFSRAGVLRGLHYQAPPAAHAKLVRCAAGEILDVAVDLRRGSPTHGAHVAVTLSGENGRLLYVPEGFAHGFLALSDATVTYKLTAEYAPEWDRGLAWDDPDLAIPWGVSGPILSERDRRHPTLAATDSPFRYGAGAR